MPALFLSAANTELLNFRILKTQWRIFMKFLADVARHLEQGTKLEEISAERFLQGPFSDAMTHAGQMAMLRRLFGSPVPPENFVFARVDSGYLGSDQPPPVSPDAIWPERPESE